MAGKGQMYLSVSPMLIADTYILEIPSVLLGELGLTLHRRFPA
jgi:hypothetical protein